MSDANPPTDECVPGFRTVWTAKDGGPRQDVTCPRCDEVFGTVGEAETKELLCRDCQTIYLVNGNPRGEPTAESLRRTIVVETTGDSRLGDALRGIRPACFGLTAGDMVFNAVLIILLFVAIAIAMG